jgi:virginiamycin B lyase
VPNSVPYGLRAAPDGSLWIAQLGTNKLARVNPADGSLKEFDLPDRGARPRRLVVDPEGIVWYTDYARGYLGALDPVKGKVREWRTPSANSAPYAIDLGTDGRLWFNESATGLMVAFDPRTERMDTVRIPTPGSTVRNSSLDAKRGRLWLALSGTGRLGRIDVSGAGAPAR